jgi:hypothetical protein
LGPATVDPTAGPGLQLARGSVGPVRSSENQLLWSYRQHKPLPMMSTARAARAVTGQRGGGGEGDRTIPAELGFNKDLCRGTLGRF